MNILIADTFTDSLARLTGDEQKSVKTTAFDLQIDPASPGMKFHKLDKAKDKNFWSVRVNADISDRTAGTVLSVATNSSENDFRSGLRHRVCGSGAVCVCVTQSPAHPCLKKTHRRRSECIRHWYSFSSSG